MNHLPFTSFLQDLNNYGIRYALLRDHPETQGIRDLDILIDPRLRQDFLSCGLLHKFCIIKNGRWNPGKMVMLKWAGNNSYILDIHESLIYRGYEYLDAQKTLARRQRKGEYFFLSKEDELLTLLFHNVLAKGQIQEKHTHRLEQLLQSKLDDNYIHSHLEPYGLTAIFLKIRKNFSTLSRQTKKVRVLQQAALKQLTFRPLNNGLHQLRLNYVRPLAKWIGRRRGALIVFIGPDGCGKSSTTAAIKQSFRSATLTTDIVYLGPWGQSQLPLVKWIKALGCKPADPNEKAIFRGQADITKNKDSLTAFQYEMRSHLFYTALAIELWYRYFFLVMPKLRRGRIVLADRYIYDILIGYRNRPSQYAYSFRQWLCAHYPKPDVVILLDADAETIYKRKPQYDRTQLDDIRQRYHNIGETYHFDQLDTSINVEATLESFKRYLLPKVMQTLKL